MHARALCIGQYIAAADFGVKGIIDAKEPTFTIGQARHEQVADMKKPDKELTKGILYFQDYPRGWVINKTNMQLLIGLFGDDTDRWVGKRVTLAAQLVSVGRGKELGIRVHGSPELDREIEVVVKLPKKSPQTFKLVPTGRPTGNATKQTGPTARSIFFDCVAEAGMDADKVATFIARFNIGDNDKDSFEAVWRDLQPGGPLREEFDNA